MSSLYQRQSGIYYYQRYWYNPEKEEREKTAFSLKTRDEHEAKQKQKKWDEHFDKKEKGKNPSDVEYREAKEEYLEMRKRKVEVGELSGYTFTSDKNAFNQFEKWVEKEKIDPYILNVEDNEENIREFKYWRLKEVSKTTVGNNLRHLSIFFSWIHEQKIIDEQPFSRIDIPTSKRSLDVATGNDWKHIKDEIEIRAKQKDDPFWVALYILSRTGMRIGEVIRLTWEKAFTDRDKYAYLNQAAKTATIYFKARRRTVPLKNVFDGIETLERSDNSAYLFESPNRGKDTHVRRDSWSRRTSNFLSDLGYEELTAHSFRHSLITELVQKNVSYKKIADIVGHSRSHIVDRYSHLEVSDLETELDKIE